MREAVGVIKPRTQAQIRSAPGKTRMTAGQKSRGCVFVFIHVYMSVCVFGGENNVTCYSKY